MKVIPLILTVVALVLSAGCKPKAKDVTPLQRKEAANLASEAQFALTLRDYARAEPLFEKAAKLSPDTGDFWVNLGVTRRRLGNKSGAKSAYESALSAYRDIHKLDPKETDSLLQEVYVLALLGKVDDARKALEKAQKKFPESRSIRGFVEAKQLDHIVEDATFKEIAL
jgi:tetratricopeptide (TPR) repeat protein